MMLNSEPALDEELLKTHLTLAASRRPSFVGGNAGRLPSRPVPPAACYAAP
jgi:hypothetical protein